MKKDTVVIIGGGFGGLMTGAILAREGLDVTVLEKNMTAGGGLQAFHRFGETFDTGMHVIGGMRQAGNVRKICRYLGIEDKVRLRDVDADCADKLYFAEDKTDYVIAQGRKGFVDSLARIFPEEEQQLQAYVDALYALTEEVDLFYLRRSGEGLAVHSDEFTMPADGFIAKYIQNEKLRSVLAYQNPLYGGRSLQTPAYIHAIISVLYIEGASRFVGSSDKFAELLVEVIKQHGGRVCLHDGVAHIHVEDRNVHSVVTQKGLVYQADYYISAVHPCSLLALLDDNALPKSYRNRLDAIPNSYSAFCMYLKMKENTFPYINHSEFYMTRYDDVWNFGRMDKLWPLGFLLMTPPDEEQGPYSRRVIVTAPMAFGRVKDWEHTTVGKRGEAYQAWKQDCAEKLLDLIEEMHPGFRQSVEDINTASPLTIRDYYNVKEGALYGYSKDCQNMALSQVPVVTKIRNLYLTGQNNNLHGFCGVALTAIITSEVILGKNYVIDRINEYV